MHFSQISHSRGNTAGMLCPTQWTDNQMPDKQGAGNRGSTQYCTNKETNLLKRLSKSINNQRNYVGSSFYPTIKGKQHAIIATNHIRVTNGFIWLLLQSEQLAVSNFLYFTFFWGLLGLKVKVSVVRVNPNPWLVAQHCLMPEKQEPRKIADGQLHTDVWLFTTVTILPKPISRPLSTNQHSTDNISLLNHASASNSLKQQITSAYPERCSCITKQLIGTVLELLRQPELC